MNTKTQHTPGPWELSSRASIVQKGPWRTAIAITHSKITRVDAPSLEEADANARLIAAAPDLLEALEDLVNIVHPKKPEGGFDDLEIHKNYGIYQPIKNSLAAIAKAKGGAA